MYQTIHYIILPVCVSNSVLFFSLTFSKDQHFLSLLNFGRITCFGLLPWSHLPMDWSMITNLLETNKQIADNSLSLSPLKQTSQSFKNNHPSGVVSLLIFLTLHPPHNASTPPIPRAPPAGQNLPNCSSKLWIARIGSTGPPATLQPPAKGANGMGQLGTSHPTEIHLPRTTGRGNLLPE